MTYQDFGCYTRDEYLSMLAEDYGVLEESVRMVAALLGPEEDFDGLVAMVDDLSQLEAYQQ